MKRSFPLESASDRAQKLRKHGKLRIPLDQIGFLPENRGGVGIIPNHVHEVAWDICGNGTKIARYVQVEVVEIPAHRLADVLARNKQMCEGSKLMPQFSPNMKFGTLGKSHFLHAQKLGKEGGHFVMGEGKLRIRWQEGDSEGHEIMEKGPICVVYDAKLLDDHEALSSIMSDDNLNATIQLSEDEMQAFGRVDALCDVMALSQSKGDAPLDCMTVLERVRASGLGVFTEQDWLSFIILRSKLPPNVAKLFIACQFQAAAGRARVKPADFGLVGKLDSRFSWVKVAIILWQYVSTVGANAMTGPSGSSSLTFAGRVDHYAKKLNPNCLKDLEQDVAFLWKIENYIRESFKHYNPPKDDNGLCDPQKLLCARTKLLSECGKLVLRVGMVLLEIAQKEKALSQSLKAEEKEAKQQEAMKGKFAKIEQNFREGLLEANAWNSATIPPAKHEITPPVQQAGAPGSRQTSRDTHKLLMPMDESQCVLTESDVLSRLDIDGPGGVVLISMFVARDLLRPIKKEPVPAKAEPDGDAACAAAGVSDVSVVPSCARTQPPIDTLHVHAKVMSLNLPKVLVVLQVEGADPGGVLVDADVLLPVPSTTTSKRKVMPTEPALMSSVDVVERLPRYEVESTMLPLCCSLAGYAIHWANSAAQESVQGVSVLLLSEKGKLPYMFKVVADEDFKKGELVLAPSGGSLCRPDASAAVEASRKHKGIMHAAMKSSVSLNVNIVYKGSQPIENKFVVISPLHQGKSDKLRYTCYNNIAPYWAVCSAAASSFEHTMEVDTIVFTDGFSVQTGKYPKLPRGTQFNVALEVFRNVKKIAKGDVLLLPFESRSEM